MAVEEQTQYDLAMGLNGGGNEYCGQRLTIPNRKVTKLGFWLHKEGTLTGNVQFEIRRISPDEIIMSKVWGLANDLATSPTYYEVTFDTPQTINEEVRIVAHYLGPAYLRVNYKGENVKEDEVLTWKYTTWDHSSGDDCAYRYTYEVPQPGAPRQQMATFLRR